jgi:hypothetical protein
VRIRWTVLLLLLPILAAPARGEAKPRWIVVTAPAFDEVVLPLVEHRAARGYDALHVRAAEVWTGVSGDVARAARLGRRVRELCREAAGACAILLVGNANAAGDAPADAVLPAFPGTQGRMRLRPTDNPYGRLDDDLVPDVAVGRYPARTVSEARAMVEKTIRFETSPPPGAWRDRVTLLVGHPGGSSPLEQRFASYVVRSAIGAGFEGLSPRWRLQALVHMEESPFCVPDDDLDEASLALLRRGQLFTIYLGHSGSDGLSSGGRRFLRRDTWGGADLGDAAGILLSCGCHTCELGTPFYGEGYGLAALRNPRGPVAVVGAHGESYGAIGKLAFEGILPLLRSDDPPRDLGAWWLAAARGIGFGPMSATTFWLYDQADGTGGKVPLDEQRLEHLEMWMLLGDPALELPLAPLDVALEATVDAAGHVVLRGRLPAGFDADAEVEVEVARAAGRLPAALPELPAQAGTERDAALRERAGRANDPVLASARLRARDGAFAWVRPLPEGARGEDLVLRARAVRGDVEALGAVRVPASR